MDGIMSAAPWAVYLAAFFGPFVQEDAAILGAATAAAAMDVSGAGVFASVLSGLVLSDGWKYWAGRLAERWMWTRKLVGDARVQAARDSVLKRLGATLFAARFVPGTRVPLYVACGVFRAPFWRFLVLIALSGALYVGLAFALFASVDMMVGQRLRMWAPVVALGLVAVVLGAAWVRRRLAKRA